MKRLLEMLLLGAGMAMLAGCAGLNTLRSDVATFGDWPANRKAGAYAFERLPSQQAQGELHDKLEAAAAPALAAAGFRPVDAGKEPELIVQVGARVSRVVPYSPWDDPLWWRGGFGHWRHGPWIGPRWGVFATYDPPRVEREVALLVRERASGKPLYEARASSDGVGGTNAAVLAAMFAAAMKDFPAIGPNPRQVSVPLATP
jgi:Domain of unknown function (DUF4136)